MKAKYIIITFLLLVGTFSKAQEKDQRARLNIGYASNMVANEKNIYIVTLNGDFCHTGINDEMWNYSSSTNTYEALCPLTGRLIIAGRTDRWNGLLKLSDDGGKTWKDIDTGETKCGYVDAAFCNGKDKVWIADKEGHVFYSADRGDTWKTLNILTTSSDNEEIVDTAADEELISIDEITAADDDDIEVDTLAVDTTAFEESSWNGPRVNDIYYSDDNTGWYSFVWNLIYMVKDNGETVTRIATPLDQKKYVTSEHAQPRVEKFRTIGNYYFVTQNQIVFISDKDNLDWQKNDTISWFDVTPEGNMITISSQGYVTSLDRNLRPIWQQRLPIMEYRDRAVQGENLCLLEFDGNIVVVGKDGIKETEKFCKDRKILGMKFEDDEEEYDIDTDKIYLPISVKDNSGNYYYYEYGDVVCHDSKENGWYRVARLNRPIRKIWMNKGQLMVADDDTNKYNVNLNDHTITPAKKPEKLFEGLTVKGLRFTHASRGCFHYWFAIRNYELKGDALVFKSDSLSDKRNKNAFEGIPKTIFLEKANELLNAVAQSIIAPEKEECRLVFTEQDKEDYRKVIDKLFKDKKRYADDPYYPNPLDQKFYLSVVDSLETLSNEDYQNIFYSKNDLYCTTTNIKMVTLILSDGSNLDIYDSGYLFNYMYCPWSVDYCDEPFECKSLHVSNIINEMTNGKFIKEPYNEHKFAIFKIASYLFQKYKQ